MGVRPVDYDKGLISTIEGMQILIPDRTLGMSFGVGSRSLLARYSRNAGKSFLNARVSALARLLAMMSTFCACAAAPDTEVHIPVAKSHLPSEASMPHWEKNKQSAYPPYILSKIFFCYFFWPEIMELQTKIFSPPGSISPLAGQKLSLVGKKGSYLRGIYCRGPRSMLSAAEK